MSSSLRTNRRQRRSTEAEPKGSWVMSFFKGSFNYNRLEVNSISHKSRLDYFFWFSAPASKLGKDIAQLIRSVGPTALLPLPPVSPARCLTGEEEQKGNCILTSGREGCSGLYLRSMLSGISEPGSKSLAVPEIIRIYTGRR